MEELVSYIFGKLNSMSFQRQAKCIVSMEIIHRNQSCNIVVGLFATGVCKVLLSDLHFGFLFQ